MPGAPYRIGFSRFLGLSVVPLSGTTFHLLLAQKYWITEVLSSHFFDGARAQPAEHQRNVDAFQV
jgi:hypothetical protein